MTALAIQDMSTYIWYYIIMHECVRCLQLSHFFATGRDCITRHTSTYTKWSLMADDRHNSDFVPFQYRFFQRSKRKKKMMMTKVLRRLHTGQSRRFNDHTMLLTGSRMRVVPAYCNVIMQMDVIFDEWKTKSMIKNTSEVALMCPTVNDAAFINALPSVMHCRGIKAKWWVLGWELVWVCWWMKKERLVTCDEKTDGTWHTAKVAWLELGLQCCGCRCKTVEYHASVKRPAWGQGVRQSLQEGAGLLLGYSGGYEVNAKCKTCNAIISKKDNRTSFRRLGSNSIHQRALYRWKS